jgi:hypothetical protein
VAVVLPLTSLGGVVRVYCCMVRAAQGTYRNPLPALEERLLAKLHRLYTFGPWLSQRWPWWMTHHGPSPTTTVSSWPNLYKPQCTNPGKALLGFMRRHEVLSILELSCRQHSAVLGHEIVINRELVLTLPRSTSNSSIMRHQHQAERIETQSTLSWNWDWGWC